MKKDEIITELFMALPAMDRRDIADKSGMSMRHVDRALTLIRRPEEAEDWGWTVPHVPRGTGVHLYQAIEYDADVALTEDEVEAILEGVGSTTATIGTQSTNQAYVMRLASSQVAEPALRKLYGALATELESVASIAAAIQEEVRRAA